MDLSNTLTVEGTLNFLSLIVSGVNVPEMIPRVQEKVSESETFLETQSNSDALELVIRLRNDLAQLLLRSAISKNQHAKESADFIVKYQKEIARILADCKRPPLGKIARIILKMLRDLDETEALTAEEIADALSEMPERIILDASTIRKRHLSQLKPYGLTSTGIGYCIR